MRLVMGLLMCAVVFGDGALANETTRAAATTAAKKMLEDGYVYMGVAYLCTEALGSGHYFAAKAAVEGAIRLGGKSQTQSVIITDDLDKRIKLDHKKKAPPVNDAKCMDTLLTAQNDFRVSTARFEEAAAADK